MSGRKDGRILIYSHDTFGLGHLRRCRTIAHSLVQDFSGMMVLIISGSQIAGAFDYRARVDFVVERAGNTVSGEDRKPDLRERRAEGLGKLGLIPRVAGEIGAKVQRGDPIIFVELVALVLGQAIGVRLRHLIVFREVPVERVRIGHGPELSLGRRAFTGLVCDDGLLKWPSGNEIE